MQGFLQQAIYIGLVPVSSSGRQSTQSARAWTFRLKRDTSSAATSAISTFITLAERVGEAVDGAGSFKL